MLASFDQTLGAPGCLVQEPERDTSLDRQHLGGEPGRGMLAVALLDEGIQTANGPLQARVLTLAGTPLIEADDPSHDVLRIKGGSDMNGDFRPSEQPVELEASSS